MQQTDEIKSIVKQHKAELERDYKVKSLAIFGSYARGEQTKDSDVDILVEFDKVIDLFKFIELENYLSDIVYHKVDLIMKDALKPRIRDGILKEAVNI
ncbi:MAG: nucleotidyltransferase family protein [Elusimicrobia bacterium]|nr:nucleotidyltransferase family protein [Elusimicrobiota bacterium]